MWHISVAELSNCEDEVVGRRCSGSIIMELCCRVMGGMGERSLHMYQARTRLAYTRLLDVAADLLFGDLPAVLCSYCLFIPQILRPEMEKLRDIMLFHESAVQVQPK